MLGPYVCGRCRQRFLQKAQQIRAVGFISLSETTKPPGDSPPPDHNPQPAQSQHGHDSNIAPKRSWERRGRSSHWPVSNPAQSSLGGDSALEDLFWSNQRHKPLPPRLPYSGTATDQSNDMKEPSRPPESAMFDRLSRLFYEKKTPIQEVWNTCETLFAMGTIGEMAAIRTGAAPSVQSVSSKNSSCQSPAKMQSPTAKVSYLDPTK